MAFAAPDPQLAYEYAAGTRDSSRLMAEARRLRDERGRTITYSRKVFIPLTTMCRDRCTYCTFAKPPGAGGEYLEPDDVIAIARGGERHGCTEALLTLGDAPEERWPQARAFLDRHGATSTLDYVRAMAELLIEETSLFPHANPGLMSAKTISDLRPSNVSMGLMLENISSRLMERGMPHFECPDKVPQRRMDTIDAAGEAMVPFTTGVLVGIGETSDEVVDSLFALAEANAKHGHIQEVIVQNFRAKADTLMRHKVEPSLGYFARIVALTRWILGPEVNVQVPPNLSRDLGRILDAGINDWGGVSPVTIDWVNPEAPWPQIDMIRSVTEAAGYQLRPRLPVYPEYISDRWIDAGLRSRVDAAIDEAGYATISTEVIVR